MRKYLPALFIAVTLLISLLVFDRLPDRMPSHWNASGEVDGYSSRLVGAFLLPLIALAIWGLLRVLPRIDPRRRNYQKFEGMYDLLVVSVVGFLCVMHLGILAFSLGYPVSVDKLIFGCMAVLLMVLGNLLPRARPNWFVGLRTPWTLSSDRVWERTHRAGGYVFLLAGLTMLLTLLLAPAYTMHATIAIAVGITAFVLGYSYLAWRQEGGN
ncbi:MAG TPA: DUF1648 domain-containing protein [Gemmatimonadaceae bacterium]|nr:DUF1648 domain-containing protein [Gemmatimonadaceae bacterium]